MTLALEVNEVSVHYGNVTAVVNAKISLGQGQIHALIGSNGAGKTSLLNAVMGVIPSSGELQMEGSRISHLPTYRRVAGGLALVPEKRDLFGSMNVYDNILLGAYARGRAEIAQSMEEIFILFPRLRERRRQYASTLSGGERQMLAMARALMSRPKVLLLDEPSLGLAPRIVEQIMETILRLKASGLSVLLVEQNARAALKVSDYAYVMERSEIIKQGSPADFLQSDDLVATYFGS